MSGITIRDFAKAQAGGGVFYNAGVPYDSDGALLVGNLGQIGQKEGTPGGIFCDWSADYGTLAMVSTDANDNIALDTTVMLDGFPCVKCTFSDAATGTFIADYTPTNAISLSYADTICVPVKITQLLTASNVGLDTVAFQVWLTLTGGSKSIRLQCRFDGIRPGGWHVFAFNRDSTQITFGNSAVIGELDTLNVTKITIVQATLAASNAAPVWVGPLRVNPRATGRVSIVMDGCYASQYSIIKPILDRYAFKSSLAIVNSSIDASATFMTEAQVDEMYDDGHECIHHTYDGSKTGGYVTAGDWATGAAITADVNLQWEYFRARGWTRGLGKAVTPYNPIFDKGTAVARQKLVYTALRDAGIQCLRTSYGIGEWQMQLGYKPPDPWLLQGAIQITSTDTAADVQAVIDQAERDGTWAIITIHKAVASSPGSLEMTTANFETWLAYLATRVAAGGIVCSPMGEVYDKFYQ